MQRLGLLAFLLGAVGCLTPWNLVQVPGSRARVYGSEEIRQLVELHEPAIIAMLGTRWEKPYVIVATKKDIGYRGYTRHWDRRVVIHNPEVRPKNLSVMVLHELAHVHMRDEWEELPPVLQEGVAYWVAIRVLELPIVMGEPPTPEQRRRVLTMTNDEYLALDNYTEINETAAWMASELF